MVLPPNIQLKSFVHRISEMEPHVTSASEMPVSAAAEASWWPHQPSDNNTTSFGVSTDGDATRQGGILNPTQVQTLSITPSATASRASIPVACVACRSRHLKCDGGNRCSRCKADGVECSYIKSRRGWKGKRKNKTASTPQSGQRPATGKHAQLVREHRRTVMITKS